MSLMQGLYGGWLLVSARSFCAHYSWLLPVGSRLRAELVLTPWRFARVPDRPEDREIHFGRSLAAAAEYQGDHSRSLAYELPSDAASTGWPVAPGPRIKSSLYPALRGISLYRRIPRAAVSCTSRRADVPGLTGRTNILRRVGGSLGTALLLSSFKTTTWSVLRNSTGSCCG